MTIENQNGSNGYGTKPVKSMFAEKARNSFGTLSDTARAEPVTIEKYGRPSVVSLSVDERRRILNYKTQKCTVRLALLERVKPDTNGRALPEQVSK